MLITLCKAQMLEKNSLGFKNGTYTSRNNSRSLCCFFVKLWSLYAYALWISLVQKLHAPVSPGVRNGDETKRISRCWKLKKSSKTFQFVLTIQTVCRHWTAVYMQLHEVCIILYLKLAKNLSTEITLVSQR